MNETQSTKLEKKAPYPRVLQVLPTLKTGGAEKTTVDIVKALVGETYAGFVASSGGRLVPEIEACGGTHIVLPLDTKNPIVMWRNAGRLTQLIRKHDIKVIHARSRGPAWSALWAARRTGIKFVTTYHGAYSQKNGLKAFYNSVMARADRVIANSNWTADLIAKRHPWAKDRIVPIARGTDFSQFALESVGDDRLARMCESWGLGRHKPKETDVILLLGRLTRLKGHEYLIEAAAQMQTDFPNCLFIFAGDAHGRKSYEENLRSKIDELGLQKRILITGHCDDPVAALALADVVVSASTQAEAFGRTIVEAAALEKPVVVTNIGAVVETVLATPQVKENERTGWKVEPANAEGLSVALKEVLSLTQSQRKAVGKRARAYVSERFSLQQMCQKTLEVYEKLLKS